VPAADIAVAYSADVRYIGQGHEVTVPFPPGTLGPASRQSIIDEFEGVYRRLYGRVADGVPYEVVNWRVTVSGPPPSLDLRRSTNPNGRPAATSAIKGHRPVYFPQYAGYHDTPVYDRYTLRSGATISGPAIVEERESTAVIGPEGTGVVDELSNLVVRLRA
jgi:N-methylhydantoinase A/oxoprolinase/acetone carboxylase beta subunit